MTLRFSDLKKISLSPAHFKAGLETPFEKTRSMRIGSIAHHILLGANTKHPMVRFDGEARRGKAWEAFEAANAGAEIVTAPEWAEAEPIAEAVRMDPVAGPMLVGARFEVPLTWEEGGFACETGGIDIVGDGWIADLKTTQSSHPGRWQKLAWNLCYPQQMAWYDAACRANGIDTSKGHFLIGVETSAPYPVTVLRLPREVLDLGAKSCALWLEKLRACRENDFWPGYVQSVVDMEIPLWMADGDGEEVDA